MHALTDIVRRTQSGKNARSTRVITQCRRTSQPDSSRMRASSSFERVFHAFLPKSTPSRTNAHRKKNERVNPLSKKKGNSRYFYPRQHELMVTYAFFFEPFFPFESLLFFPTAIMYVRVKTMMQAGGGVQRRQFFFSLFFFVRGRPAQVAQPQTSSSFAFYLIQIEFSPYFCLVLERRRARE